MDTVTLRQLFEIVDSLQAVAIQQGADIERLKKTCENYLVRLEELKKEHEDNKHQG